MKRHMTKRAEECRRMALMYFDRVYNVNDDVIIRRYYNDGREFDI